MPLIETALHRSCDVSCRSAVVLGALLIGACHGAMMDVPDEATAATPAPPRDGSSPSPIHGEGDASHESGDAQDAGGCVVDDDCNGGAKASQLICASSGTEHGQCIHGCHTNADCPSSETCDTTASPHWSCVQTDAGSDCPVITYPSGLHVQTYADAAMSATYANHLSAGQVAPTCFVDVDRLFDPTTGTTSPLSAQVSAHYTFDELVGTEVLQGFGHDVLLSPAAVTALEAFRDLVGQPVSVNSGYRSPRHQESVCQQLCGDPLGCAGTCANSSRHMWGDAFDLPLAFYSAVDEDRACSAGFRFAYLESGTHLHIDQNPAYATCLEQ